MLFYFLINPAKILSASKMNKCVCSSSSHFRTGGVPCAQPELWRLSDGRGQPRPGSDARHVRCRVTGQRTSLSHRTTGGQQCDPTTCPHVKAPAMVGRTALRTGGSQGLGEPRRTPRVCRPAGFATEPAEGNRNSRPGGQRGTKQQLLTCPGFSGATPSRTEDHTVVSLLEGSKDPF